MKVLLVEPYFTGSHKSWALEFAQFSSHEVKIISLSGHYWKWRMHGGAVTLARKFLSLDFRPDLILVSDMLDLTTFLSLTRHATSDIPTAVYFHENQLTYPWSPSDKDIIYKRDNHYGFINYSTALAADHVFFNSRFHHDAFLGELPNFLIGFPDNNELRSVEEIRKKCSVLPLGMDLKKLVELKPDRIEEYPRAVLLWNHRWEYDKNPEDFFDALFELQDRGVDFRLVVLGANFSRNPEIFDRAGARLADKILHFGFVEDERDYVKWLWHSDIVPVTSHHDFFGASLVQAMYCDVAPLLPARLAYPEHIPEKFHRTFFYKDQRDFINRLQRLIFNVKVLRKQKTGHFVEKYDWQQLISQYDSALEQIIELKVHGISGNSSPR